MSRRWRLAAASLLSLCLVAVGASPASSVSPASSTSSASPSSRDSFPAEFPLPNGFRPEGVTIGPGPFGYFGSLADGSIYRADLRTGAGRVISTGPGTPSVGLKIDRRGRLFVSGGVAGNARVVDSRTGRVLAAYQLSAVPAFVNDVILTRDAAWFTDSTNPVLYKLKLGRDGSLPAAAERLPLVGVTYGPGINANGISNTPDGRRLLVMKSNEGKLLRVHPATGQTEEVDLAGETLQFGDGLLRQGRTLYVVQNRANTVAVLRLNAAGTSARIVQRITDPRFDVPTTVAALGHRLYLPNARFSTTPTPDTTYNVVAIRGA